MHSAFRGAVNLMLDTNRMLTLVPPTAPNLPDSLRVPEAALCRFYVGQRTWLNEGELVGEGVALGWTRCADWDGRISARADAPPRPAPACAAVPCGLDGVSAYGRAASALLADGMWDHLGLGKGLTPSYDDMCVGAMAVCRAAGQAHPPLPDDLGMTTDVSARYLRLAAEGFFSQPVKQAVACLWDENSASALDALLAVGATSGADMLRGMVLAIERIFYSGETV